MGLEPPNLWGGGPEIDGVGVPKSIGLETPNQWGGGPQINGVRVPKSMGWDPKSMGRGS